MDSSDNNCDMNTNGELKVIEQYIPNAKIIFDVGLEKGTWTKRALKVNPTAEYHCFEPNINRIPQDLPSNVIVNNFALGNLKEKKTLYVFGEGCDSLYDRPILHGKLGLKETMEVEVYNLDDYCEEHSIKQIDFMKIDTEGNELEVLKGAQKILNNNIVKMVQFEYGGCYIDAGTTLKDIYDFIHANVKQYSFFKIYPDRLLNVSLYDEKFETFQYSNWLIAFKR